MSRNQSNCVYNSAYIFLNWSFFVWTFWWSYLWNWNLCSLLPFLFRWEYFLCRTERDFNHSPTCDEAFPCSGRWTRSWHCNIWWYSHCLCSGWWTFTSHQMQDTVFHTLSFTGWGVLRWPECAIRAYGELLKITETTLPFFSSHLREVIYKAATLLALFPYLLIPSLLLLNRKLASHTIDEVFQFYVIRDFEWPRQNFPYNINTTSSR